MILGRTTSKKKRALKKGEQRESESKANEISQKNNAELSSHPGKQTNLQYLCRCA